MRLKDMDRLHVDVQVVYPTLFLVYLTDDVELEIALSKAYNRFMSEACSNDGHRLRWVAVLPLRSVEDSLKEIKWAKDDGAVGLFFRGLEKDRNLDDSYFFPGVQAAMDYDLSICIHTGAGSPVMSSLFNVDRHSVFCHGRLLPLIAFRNLVANRIPELFPDLKIRLHRSVRRLDTLSTPRFKKTVPWEMVEFVEPGAVSEIPVLRGL